VAHPGEGTQPAGFPETRLLAQPSEFMRDLLRTAACQVNAGKFPE
jgi:hypothetical protein